MVFVSVAMLAFLAAASSGLLLPEHRERHSHPAAGVHAHEHGHVHAHAHGHECGHQDAQSAFYAAAGCDADSEFPQKPCRPGHDDIVTDNTTNTELRRRRLAAIPWRPIKMTFDTSKIDSDPGFMCTVRGETVKLSQAYTENEKLITGYTCGDNDILTPEKRAFLKNILVPKMKSYFETNPGLMVQIAAGESTRICPAPCGTNLHFTGCSGQPSEGKMPSCQTVPDTDYVLHVTARPTTGTTLAWALSFNDAPDGRPIFGQANFGPHQIDPSVTNVHSLRHQESTAVHEAAHALGFSSSHYGKMIDPVTQRAYKLGQVVQKFTERGTTVHKIVTPEVKKAVQAHFGTTAPCSNMLNAGAELENGGGSGTGGSHWEKRVYNNEFMTGSSSADPVYSDITLAFFEDTGWYKPGRSNPDFLAWGFGQGCNFPTQKCSQWPKERNYRCEIADSLQVSGCSHDFVSKAYCSITTHTAEIPVQNQYFPGQPEYGGFDDLMDYCPVYKKYDEGDCRNEGRLPSKTNSAAGEALGQSSRCIMQTAAQTGVFSQPTPICHEIECHDIPGTSDGLELDIYFGPKTDGGTNFVRCVKNLPSQNDEGKQVSANSRGGLPAFQSGTVTCPHSIDDICRSLSRDSCPRSEGLACSGHGKCKSNNQCDCSTGFTGAACNEIQCKGLITINGKVEQCSGHGACNSEIGLCTCSAKYKGEGCEEARCITNIENATKNDFITGVVSECSGHGACASGTCNCTGGYNGASCEVAPGCNPASGTESSCDPGGECDTLSGSCACHASHVGKTCNDTFPPQFTELRAGAGTHQRFFSVGYKEYKYFKFDITENLYDVTIVLSPVGGVGLEFDDVDMYAVILPEVDTISELPSPKLGGNGVFKKSHVGRDEIHLCGHSPVYDEENLSTRNTLDRHRKCEKPTPEYSVGHVLYIGVLGYHCGNHTDDSLGLRKQCSTNFTITVEEDGCIERGQNSSSVTDDQLKSCGGDRGVCGRENSGICSCNRGWTGPECTQPRCGPFPEDAVNGIVGPYDKMCYGNGKCVEVGGNATFAGTPTCDCDSSHPVQKQDALHKLCAVLADSVQTFKAEGELRLENCSLAGLGGQKISEDVCKKFTHTDSVGVGEWAIYRLSLANQNTGLLVAELYRHDKGSTSRHRFDVSDPILVVRQDDLPTLDVQVGFNASTEAKVVALEQHADFASWSADSSDPTGPVRRVVVDGSNTYDDNSLLLTGRDNNRVFIGVHNSRYGRAVMDFELRVTLMNVGNGSASQQCPDHDAFQCSGRGTCSVSQGRPLCTCRQAVNTNSLSWLEHETALPPETKTFYTGVACEETRESIPLTQPGNYSFEAPALAPGSAFYFDINITSPVRLRQIAISLEPEVQAEGHRPPQPLLLVEKSRTPYKEGGPPRLDRDALSDFLALSKLSAGAVQTVVLHDCELEDKTKCPSQSALHRTQVAVFNRASAKGQLKFKIKMEVKDEVIKRTCATDGVESTLLDTTFCSGHGVCQDTPTLAHGYECKCLPSWTGTSCSSPDKDAFSMAELQHAASQVTRLCNTCDDDTATLSQGAIVLYRFDQPAQADKGLELTISSKSGVGDPDVFVADELPRSLFDFKRIAATAGPSEKLQLTEKTESGVYWVAIRSSAGDTTLLPSISSGPESRRRLDSTGEEQYKLRAEIIEVQVDQRTSVTDQKFAGELSNWLTSTGKGLGTLIACSVIMLCLCGGCIFRMCFNKDLDDTARDKLNKQVQRTVQRDEAAAAHVASHVSNPVRTTQNSIAPSAPIRPNSAQQIAGGEINSPVHDNAPASARFDERSPTPSAHSGRQTSQYVLSSRGSSSRVPAESQREEMVGEI